MRGAHVRSDELMKDKEGLRDESGLKKWKEAQKGGMKGHLNES